LEISLLKQYKKTPTAYYRFLWRILSSHSLFPSAEVFLDKRFLNTGLAEENL